jgi:hypothetical protein
MVSRLGRYQHFWGEILLEQDKDQACKNLLEYHVGALHISDVSLHNIL